VTEAGGDQHQRRAPIRERAHHAGAAAVGDRTTLIERNEVKDGFAEVNTDRLSGHGESSFVGSVRRFRIIYRRRTIPLRLELVARKAAIEQLQGEYAFSQRRGCELLQVAVGTFRYASRRSDEPLRTRLTALAREKPRFGYRRLHVLLRRDGDAVNHKRVHRVYRAAGLAIRRKKRKHCARVGQPLTPRTAPNQEWALDFVADRVECGRAIRVLSVADAFTRECLALEVDTSFASPRVTRVLEAIAAERGLPQWIRCDNGSELTSRHFLAWCVEHKVEPLHIQPGRPVQNGRLESFNGRMRDELLNISWFHNLFDARRKVAAWRREYNETRPHSSLGYLTPHAFAARAAGPGKDGGRAALENPSGFPLSHGPTTAGFSRGAQNETHAPSTMA